MAKRISDFIIMSDIDGTLIHNDQIPQRNIDALQRFAKGGGKLGLSTGRSLMNYEYIAAQLPINLPCVLFNGSMIFDRAAQKIIWETFLPTASRDYFERIVRTFPDAEAMVVDRSYYHEISLNRAPNPLHKHHSHIKRFHQSANEIEGTDWYKGLFLLGEERMKQLHEYLRTQNFSDVRFVNTNACMMEMLPAGSSKGEALKRLMDMEGFTADQLVAIGDYYNDFEMIKLAGLGVTIKDSPEDIKAQADLVVGLCQNGALADLVEYLEDTYGY